MQDVKENGGRLRSGAFFNNNLMVLDIQSDFSVRLRRVIGLGRSEAHPDTGSHKGTLVHFPSALVHFQVN